MSLINVKTNCDLSWALLIFFPKNLYEISLVTL